MLIDPEEVVIKNKKGDEKKFIISEIPAVQSREIIAQYPLSALPKLGDYQVNEKMFFKMMEYVDVLTEGGPIRLKTKELINNHCDFVTAARLEGLMFQKNWGFFLLGTTSTFSDLIKEKGKQLLTAISTVSSAQSSQTEKPASTS